MVGRDPREFVSRGVWPDAAEELLAHGRGFLVQFRDGASIANTVNALFADREQGKYCDRRR